MNNFYPFGFQIFAHLSLDPETIPPSWVTATDRTSKLCPERTQLNLYGATAIPPAIQLYIGLTQHSNNVATIISPRAIHHGLKVPQKYIHMHINL